jgi:hypothetical protein
VSLAKEASNGAKRLAAALARGVRDPRELREKGLRI